MQKERIILEVSPEAARAFNTAPPDLRETLQTAVNTWLQEKDFAVATLELERIMDEIGANAQQQGLTPALLDQLLHAK